MDKENLKCRRCGKVGLRYRSDKCQCDIWNEPSNRGGENND